MWTTRGQDRTLSSRAHFPTEIKTKCTKPSGHLHPIPAVKSYFLSTRTMQFANRGQQLSQYVWDTLGEVPGMNSICCQDVILHECLRANVTFPWNYNNCWLSHFPEITMAADRLGYFIRSCLSSLHNKLCLKRVKYFGSIIEIRTVYVYLYSTDKPQDVK